MREYQDIAVDLNICKKTLSRATKDFIDNNQTFYAGNLLNAIQLIQQVVVDGAIKLKKE